MNISGTSSITARYTQPGGFVTSQPAQSAQVVTSQEDLPKTDVIPASVAGTDLLQQAVNDANKLFTQIHSDVQFVVDQESKKVVVKLVESSTGEVLNQYPTDHAIEISKAIAQMQQRTAALHATFKSNHSDLQGLLFKQKS